MSLLPERQPRDVRAAAGARPDAETVAVAASILDDVAAGGDAATRAHAERFEELYCDRLTLRPADMEAAYGRTSTEDRGVLERVAERIEAFALAQRDSLREFELPVAGGVAAQRVAPVERAGCYAPGGVASLPSSLLMSAVTARAAGVPQVVAASPRPTDIVLAAAHVARCDLLLACGGAQAIGALAFGSRGRAPVDVVVGPGNRFVTAAKQLVQGQVGVDLPAGPSELCVVADATANAQDVAADLLAQAEHDVLARPWLITTAPELAQRVDAALRGQLAALPSAEVAAAALRNGGSVCCASDDEVVAVVDRLAPEHLQLTGFGPSRLAPRFSHYGALFLGAHGAEVFGDYGAGPNHVLPTAGAARYTGGLSVFTFLRIRTWLQLNRPAGSVAKDAARLAELEGLPGHAAAARRRFQPLETSS